MALIYGELNVDVPNLSLTEIEQFISDTTEFHESTHSKEEKVYFQRNNRNYPWDRRVLEFNGKEFYNYKSINPFKKIKNIIESLTIIKESRCVTMLYQKEQSEYDFNFHFDNDDSHGFRICFNLDINKIFLEIASLKHEFIDLPNGSKIENYMVKEKIYDVIPNKTNTIFCIAGKKYPHRVPVNNSSQRVSIIVRGKITTLEDLNFLRKIEE